MVISSAPELTSTITLTRVAPACRATFVSASSTMRKAAVAAGSAVRVVQRRQVEIAVEHGAVLSHALLLDAGDGLAAEALGSETLELARQFARHSGILLSHRLGGAPAVGALRGRIPHLHDAV